MIVATNRSPKNAIPIYLRRWEIESLFQGLKGRGFRFEETHMTDLDRIEKLMGVLALGFCWAHKVGEWKAQVKKAIPFKQHYNGLRPQLLSCAKKSLIYRGALNISLILACYPINMNKKEKEIAMNKSNTQPLANVVAATTNRYSLFAHRPSVNNHINPASLSQKPDQKTKD